MPKNPTFELFEDICDELAVRETAVIAEDHFDPTLINSLKKHFGQSDATVAYDKALDDLTLHFQAKGSSLPFEVNRATREFRSIDLDYIKFIAFASEHRSAGPESKNFESRTMERLALRLTGALHLVGSPRKRNKKKRELAAYLQVLGFDKNCIEGGDKDGGFDILWLPPLGAVPLRPVVSLQCKNGSFSEREANHSAGRAHRTLQRHSVIRGHNHLLFVVFNDYIEELFHRKAVGWTFVPMGLSDLGALQGGSLQQTTL